MHSTILSVVGCVMKNSTRCSQQSFEYLGTVSSISKVSISHPLERNQGTEAGDFQALVFSFTLKRFARWYALFSLKGQGHEIRFG